MSTPLWPDDVAAALPDMADLFRRAAAVPAGELVDRHRLVSYDDASKSVAWCSERYLPTVGAWGKTFLRACDPVEWARLEELRAAAGDAVLAKLGHPRILVVHDPVRLTRGGADTRLTPDEVRAFIPAEDQVPPAEEAEILAAVGLTLPEAQAKVATYGRTGWGDPADAGAGVTVRIEEVDDDD